MGTFTSLWQDKIPFKMNILLILIVSVVYQQPFAIAKPTIFENEVNNGLMNTIVDTLIENGNELGNYPKFTSALNSTIKAARDTFELLDDLCDEAKENIEKLNVEMKRLDKQDNVFHDEYFPKFNAARSKLRQVRNKLRKLAGKTVYKTRNMKNLLAALENNKKDEKVFLGAALKEMKSLMISSKKILDEALEEYNLTIEAFKNLNSAINVHNQFLKKFKDEESKEYKDWEIATRSVAYSAIGTSSVGVFAAADVFGCAGFCSVIGNSIVFGSTAAIVESTINKYKVAFKKFEKLTSNMLEKGKKIDNTMKDANAFLISEVELIVDWTNDVEQVSENMENYPEEYLRKFEAIRSIFNDGLDDLQKTAQEFLDRGKIDDDDDDDSVHSKEAAINFPT